VGCAGPSHGQLIAFLKSHEQSVSTGHYTVMPPDVIMVHAPVAMEIDGVRQQVRPDGKIALRLLGEIDVAGLTTEQIAEKLRRHLSRYYVDPEVVVDVARYASQFYYVFGQVERPGPKLFSGRDSLLTVLAEARPNFLAWRSQIRVVRPSPDEDGRKIIIVDLDHMVRSGDVTQDILLQPGDIVEVPPTPLAWLGLRVRELLYPVTPILEVYDAPADAIDSTHIYEDELGDGTGTYQSSHGRRRSR
jgi:polysaccharide export outer membrane protein